MPFKERLKSNNTPKRKKAQYKIINWSEYNKSLKKRGCLSLYLPYGDLRQQFINDDNYMIGISGQAKKYSRLYIEILFIFYKLLGMGLRQLTGYVSDMWKSQGQDIEVPSFGHISDLFKVLPIEIQHKCNKVSRQLNRKEELILIADSSGLRMDKNNEWYEAKYNKELRNRKWRKFHIGIDPEMEIISAELTDHLIDDRKLVNELINKPAYKYGKFIADRGYYSHEVVNDLSSKGIMPVIPPPKNGIVHGKEETQWHDKIVRYIKKKGTIYAFYKKYDYGLRNLAESQFSRIKRSLGEKLQTLHSESQKREAIVIANIINTWNSFGKAISTKIA